MELSLADAARILGLSEHALYWRARRGEVPAHLVGERYRFQQVELLEWAAVHQMAPGPEPADETAPTASLEEALRRGGILRDLPGDDRPSVLRALIERLPLPDPERRGTLLELVLSREELGTTAIGGEIALPHPRQPIVIGRAEPIAALGLPSTPVGFEAPDEKPVRALLLLICPTPRLHLALLRQAARAFTDQELRSRVLERATDDAIFERLARLAEPGPRSAPAIAP